VTIITQTDFAHVLLTTTNISCGIVPWIYDGFCISRISLHVEIRKGPASTYVVSIFAIGPSELANKKTELGAPYN
jgi:hypothetical protein